MRNRERGAVFRQSIGDFPQMVTLGEKSPSFGLHRFKQGLRFIPADDEGFTLRGDKRRLLYKGQRRSHRFTILGDCSFEYDCILHREPESNVISLLIDGAENFDFFRQPDFVDDPFLKGSFAVYKKDTLVGEGTGKLCHIHRPEIIDARGRRCWGALAVVRNMLYITIPEKWLADAKYPVVVDPTIGTTTIGSLYEYRIVYYTDEQGNEYYYTADLSSAYNIHLNKVLASENIGDIEEFYVYKKEFSYSSTKVNNAKPCIYNNVNNLPNTKISNYEQDIIDRYNISQPGWLQAQVGKNCPIYEGDYFWFGVRANDLRFMFDYGGILERIDVYRTYSNLNKLLPDVLGDSYYSPFSTDNNIREFRISMYLNYRKATYKVVKKILTQSVALTETSTVKADYKRMIFQSLNVSDVFHAMTIFLRQCVMNVSVNMGINRILLLLRSVIEKIDVSEIISRSWEITRKLINITVVNGEARRSKGFYRLVSDFFTGTDNSNFTILFVRCVNETKGITDGIRKWGDYFRGLFFEAGNNAETAHIGKYYRKESDKVTAKGSVLRKIFYVLKIITKAFVRDYIIGRFLKAKTELILKSRIVREINLESRIN